MSLVEKCVIHSRHFPLMIRKCIGIPVETISPSLDVFSFYRHVFWGLCVKWMLIHQDKSRSIFAFLPYMEVNKIYTMIFCIISINDANSVHRQVHRHTNAHTRAYIYTHTYVLYFTCFILYTMNVFWHRHKWKFSRKNRTPHLGFLKHSTCFIDIVWPNYNITDM